MMLKYFRTDTGNCKMSNTYVILAIVIVALFLLLLHNGFSIKSICIYNIHYLHFKYYLKI